MENLPLRGIRILALTTGAAGPTVANYLGQFGAEVINIESRVHPDTHRGGRNQERWNKSPTYIKLHRNKKSVTINMVNSRGLELANDLIRISDVVVENFTLGVLERWGLGYPNVRKVKADIVMISLRGLGSTGPRAADTTWGPNLTALFGLTHLWNYPEAQFPSSEARAQHPDFISGTCGAFAVMAALLHKARTGKGQYIDAAQVEAGAALFGPMYLDYLVNKRVQKPQGNLSLIASPHGAYRCKGEDRWCVISVTTDAEWKAFCRAIGRPDWIQDPRFATLTERLDHQKEIDGYIEKWTVQYSPHEVMEFLQSYGVPAGPVQDVEDLFTRDKQLLEEGFLVELVEPEMGPLVTEGLPLKLSDTPGSIREHAPLMGEHTWQVCRELLGLSAEEIRELEEQEVLY